MNQALLFLTLKVFSKTGGIEKVSRAMAKALSFSPGPFQVWSLYDKANDLDERYIPEKKFKCFSGNKFRFLMRAVFTPFKPQVLVLSHIHLLPVGFLLKKLFKSRLILLAHGIEIWKPATGIKRQMIQAIDDFWAVSHYTADKIHQVNSVPREKIRVLPNCLDPFWTMEPLVASSIFRKKWGYPENTKILLSICRIDANERYKGYDRIIAALPKLKAKFPEIKFLLAGQADEPEKNRILELISNAGVGNEVELLGFVPDENLTELYQLADVFVMPSKKEGFGLVFIEAASVGSAIIAGNLDGSKEALLNGRLGSLIDPDDQEELEKELIDKLEHPLSEEKREQIRKICLDKFHFNVYQQKVQTLLNGSKLGN